MVKHLLSAYVTVTPLLGISVLWLVSSRIAPRDMHPWPLIFLLAYLATAAIIVFALLRSKQRKVLSGWFGAAAVAFGLFCLTFLGDRGIDSSDILQIMTVGGIAITIGVSMLYFAFRSRIAQGSHLGLVQPGKGPAANAFIHRGKIIAFDRIAGEVIGTNKFSETHVTSSGGGGTVSGYVGPYGGHVGGSVSAPVVTSHATTKHEFWIRTDTGKEVAIKLTGVDIPLRAGQNVTLYLARNSNASEGWYCIIVNHSSETHWLIYSGKELNKMLNIEVFSPVNWLIAGVIFVATTAMMSDGNLEMRYGLSLAVAFLLCAWIIKSIKANAVARKLQKHLESVAQDTYKNAAASSSFTAADAFRAAKTAQGSAQGGVVNINIDNI